MPSFEQTTQLVEQFRELPIGWRFGRGMPISDVLISRAKNLLMQGSENGLDRFNAFAGDDGEVMVSFYVDDRILDITLNNNDTCIVVEEDYNREEVQFLEDASLQTALRALWNFSLNTTELSIPETGTWKVEDSQGLALNPLTKRK